MLQPLVDAPSPPPPTSKRLASLDILRGFTVLLMVFVDEAGVAFPAINHSAWDGITLADFVMPWFLFMVGTSLSLSLRKYRAARKAGTRAILTRALKLIGLGPRNYFDDRWCRFDFFLVCASLLDQFFFELLMTVRVRVRVS